MVCASLYYNSYAHHQGKVCNMYVYNRIFSLSVLGAELCATELYLKMNYELSKSLSTIVSEKANCSYIN